MAITEYLHKNSIGLRLRHEFDSQTRELTNLRRRKRNSVLLWSIFPCLVAPPLLPFAALAYYLAGKYGSVSLDPIALAGYSGEAKTIEMLKFLGDEYTLFNQLKLPCTGSSTGYREADFVVHGPNGIFVIESKEYAGELWGTEQDKDWHSVTRDRSGNPYSKKVANPVRQVKHYCKLLSDILKKEDADSWVEGIVSLTRNNDTTNIRSSTAEVLPVNRIIGYIERFVKRHPHQKALDVLISLSGGTKKEPAFKPCSMPVSHKEVNMSAQNKDDLLFRNVLKGFALIGIVSVVVPITVIVAPGLVKSALMLAFIGGIGFVLVSALKNAPPADVTGKTLPPSDEDFPVLDDVFLSARYGGPDYGSEGNALAGNDD